MNRLFRIIIFMLMLCILSLVSACGMKGEGAFYDEMYVSAAVPASSIASSSAAAPAAMEMRSRTTGMANDDIGAAPGTAPEEQISMQGRKLVKRADIRIRVENLEATERPLTELMEKYGAWSASTGIYENSRNYSIRVPSEFYDVMLAELTGLGKILRRTENTEDVTLRYYDLESRLAVKRELLNTYKGYLGRANDIDEILTVESRIADLQREIDDTGTQFRNLSHLIEYSTIDVGIAGPVTASSYYEPTLKEKLAELFSSFSDVASTVLVVLTGILVYGIPAVLILFLFFWILFGRIGLLKKLWRLVMGKK